VGNIRQWIAFIGNKTCHTFNPLQYRLYGYIRIVAFFGQAIRDVKDEAELWHAAGVKGLVELLA
jgi:hypothetical protein